jgi:hypothetical protein
MVSNHMDGPTGFPVMLSEYTKSDFAKINWSDLTITFKNGPSGGYEGGSAIKMCHCKDEKDKYKYQGQEIHVLLVDELTHFTESIYRFIRGRVRLGGLAIPEHRRGFFPRVLCGANPGNVGHGFVKNMFIDGVRPREIRKMPPEEGGFSRQFIPSRLEDNPTLMENDPEYEQRLEGLGNPALVRAMRHGDWDVFTGQAFNFNQSHHVVKPMPIPEGAPLYMTFDWGYGAPFSVGWWWVDADGRLYRFAEWYGWSGTPNEGLRKTDPEIAQGIREREREMGISGKNILRLAGQDCFSKKPNYQGGGQGPSTSEEFAKHGVFLTHGDPNRKLKIRQFRERLRVPTDGSRPMLVVYETCVQFIRTIPAIVMDEHFIEDVDQKGEDHIYDEACHVCMARPMGEASPQPSQTTLASRIIDLCESERTSELDDVLGVYGVDGGASNRLLGLSREQEMEEDPWAW